MSEDIVKGTEAQDTFQTSVEELKEQQKVGKQMEGELFDRMADMQFDGIADAGSDVDAGEDTDGEISA